MRKIFAALSAFIICLSQMGQLVYAQESLKIVTSFYPMYALTEAVVGDKQEVLMINSGKGIHDFEPSAGDVAAIYDADLFVFHSTILESWTKNLAENKGQSQVILLEAGKDLEMLKVPGLSGITPIEGQDTSNLYDPHSWLDPRLAAQEAQAIADQVSALDPDNKDYYQANAKAFSDQANALYEKYLPIFQAKSNKTFVTQHTAFYYLAEAFGLNQFGIAGISSEQEPSAKQLNDVIQYVTQAGVDTLFVEPNVSDKIVQVIADAAGVEVVNLSPLESDPGNDLDFLANYQAILETLDAAMK
ncbi:TPA: zinc ABC transporter substrate-binding protein [Streptococcus suis]